MKNVEHWGACVVCGQDLAAAYSRQRGYGLQCETRTDRARLRALLVLAIASREVERDVLEPVRFWRARLLLALLRGFLVMGLLRWWFAFLIALSVLVAVAAVAWLVLH